MQSTLWYAYISVCVHVIFPACVHVTLLARVSFHTTLLLQFRDIMSSAAAPQLLATEQSDVRGWRLARNGYYYSWVEFVEWYGLDEAYRLWTPFATEQSDLQGTRVARNGQSYCFNEFDEFYGTTAEAYRHWARADVSTSGDGLATEPPANFAPARRSPSPTVQGAPPGLAAVDAANDAPGPRAARADMLCNNDSQIERIATEPLEILLRPEDIQTLTAQEDAYRPCRSLHKLARNALNAIMQAGEDTNLEGWFPWQSYVACHENALMIIGTGVTGATAEFIEGTKDSNRDGWARLDFVIYRSDRTYCRLHPGARKVNDAKPLFFNEPMTIPTEARFQWSMYPRIPFTYEAAQGVPQIDRVGKRHAFRSFQLSPRGVLGSIWQVFVCNIGKLTGDVIGCGIVEAELCNKWDTGVELLFRRADASEVRLQIIEDASGSYKTKLC
jgi:hypothetical protein